MLLTCALVGRVGMAPGAPAGATLGVAQPSAVKPTASTSVPQILPPARAGDLSSVTTSTDSDSSGAAMLAAALSTPSSPGVAQLSAAADRPIETLPLTPWQVVSTPAVQDGELALSTSPGRPSYRADYSRRGPGPRGSGTRPLVSREHDLPWWADSADPYCLHNLLESAQHPFLQLSHANQPVLPGCRRVELLQRACPVRATPGADLHPECLDAGWHLDRH
jgi:hypothetical protein